MKKLYQVKFHGSILISVLADDIMAAIPEAIRLAKETSMDTEDDSDFNISSVKIIRPYRTGYLG